MTITATKWTKIRELNFAKRAQMPLLTSTMSCVQLFFYMESFEGVYQRNLFFVLFVISEFFASVVTSVSSHDDLDDPLE